MFRSSTTSNKTTSPQSSSEAGTSSQDNVNPGSSAAQATDSRCSSPDPDCFLLAMSPEDDLDLDLGRPKTPPKTKAKAKSKAPKAEKTLAAVASSVKDIHSFYAVVHKLTQSIVFAIEEHKSVTSENKKYIIQAAKEVRFATDMYMESVMEPENVNSAPEVTAPQTTPDVDVGTLKEDIVAAVREEMGKFKQELKEELATNASPSYAQVASDKSKLPPEKSPKSLYKPAIVVSPLECSDPENKQETINKFKKAITFRDKQYAPSRVKIISNNKVRVEFLNETQCQDTLKELKKSKIVSAEPAKKLRPMLILKGVSKDIPLEDLTSVIKQQNPTVSLVVSEPDDLLLRFKRNNNRNPNLYNAVFIVSPAVWREATQLGRLNVDHQQVFVGDFSPFLQCYKCLQFGHISKNCMSDCRPCSHCSDKTHQNTNCPHIISNSTPVCFNCTKHNAKTNSNINTSHSAISANCPTVQYMMNQVKCKIDYGV